jgi:hypothetical protein
MPRVFLALIASIESSSNGFKHEGVFRLNADTEQITFVVKCLEMGKYEEIKGLKTPHAPAMILKRWLRELKTPIIPSDYYLYCETLGKDILDGKDSIELPVIRSVFKKLPRTNRLILGEVIDLSLKIAAQEPFNRMSLSNLALLLGPCLLRNPAQDESDLSALVEVSKRENTFVEHLFACWSQLSLED